MVLSGKNSHFCMKRESSEADSESDSDACDDGFRSPCQSGGNIERKKRRGIIEKRRRDRINYSLSELKRLVPAAFEKQGNAKLEKAEILQMTVDHLKALEAKGVNGYGFESTSLAMHYRSLGYRECATEVARYLMSVEGLDLQDPIRVRLLGHLQCASTQREAPQCQTLMSPPWPTTAVVPSNSPQAIASPTSQTAHHPGAFYFMQHQPQQPNYSSHMQHPICSVGMGGSAFAVPTTSVGTGANLIESPMTSAAVFSQSNNPLHSDNYRNQAVAAAAAAAAGNSVAAPTAVTGYIPSLQATPYYAQHGSFSPANSSTMLSPMTSLAYNSYIQNLKTPYRPWGNGLGAY